MKYWIKEIIYTQVTQEERRSVFWNNYDISALDIIALDIGHKMFAI